MLLKKGSKGDDVKMIQKLLDLIPDGDFGPLTESAVKEWQKENGLTVDGIVGKNTWGKMFPDESEGDHSLVDDSKLEIDKLEGHIPDTLIEEIKEKGEKFGITNNLRLAHFLGQCAHESANFRFKKENLNYSEKALKSVFGKYFRDVPARDYARKPEKIGSRVYANRMGNGDEQSGEGYKFRGRGYIQLTGKNNYTKFGEFVGEDTISNPDLVSDKYPGLSAAFFFNSNNLWKICDAGSSKEDVKKLTRRVNGGYHGLQDRINKFNKFYNLLK